MTNSVPYSRLDRFLHNLAFGSDVLLDMMLDIEKAMSRKRPSEGKHSAPVFVTSLPRAGTTIILESLNRLPGMACHTYRDMPFILTPVLWDKLSSAFRLKTASRERAHGDGLFVDEDSPEAFEEVIWKHFFPDKYKADRIELWSEGDVTISFRQYFERYLESMVELRAGGRAPSGLYLSKNNGNISRIEFLTAICPEARFIIPFRDPIEHSISLMRQHQNFLVQHAEEPFVEKYMSDIGHFEFGNLHRPIDFPGMDKARAEYDTSSVDYWVSYWCCAYSYLMKTENKLFVSYESFSREGRASLARMAEILELDADDQQLDNAAAIIRRHPDARANEANVSVDLEQRAARIYRSLRQRCILV